MKTYHLMQPDRIVYAIIILIMAFVGFKFFYKKMKYDKKNTDIVLYFDFNEYKLSEKNKKILNQYFATHEKQYDKICITGHTDPVGSKNDPAGSKKLNTRFGYLRAMDTLQYLNQIDVKSKKFRVVSKDYSDPIDNSQQHLNRRVEIHLS